MAHSPKSREDVRSLRRRGLSLNQIVKKTGIPKSTLRGWIKDVPLTLEQQNILKIKSYSSLQEGRVNAQKKFKQIRFMKEKELFDKGKNEIGTLNNRELFIAGISLYWAEGFKNKHEKRLGFCNSDPKMIKFY